MGLWVATNPKSSALIPPGGAGVMGMRDGCRAEGGALAGTEARLAGEMGASSEGVGAMEDLR
jgi:hypothetical protein